MKEYLEVIAKFNINGQVIPLYIDYNKRRYKIDKIKQIIPAVSLKSGGLGLRYTCKISGQDYYLFLEEDHWFIDKKDNLY